ncbi:Ku protein [Niveispirillum irakense]|uniref:non-homologous end joining protein Ku n=1 Tax=Niveispirillum irakense TaxID=34011 RepID=UPI00041AFD00|nr:Ku protein [Niveispirillum irakense]
MARRHLQRGDNRILWRGYLKLSLVSCAVALLPAASGTDRTRTHLLNAKTGNRIRRHYVDSVTSRPVDNDQQVRGYETGKDEYLPLTEEDFEGIALESTHIIDITLFTDADAIDPVWQENSYYLVPDDKVAIEAYAVIRAAMEETGQVGIGRIVLQKRERRCVLRPQGRGILLTSLRYPYEVREDKDAFASLDAKPAHPKGAKTLLEQAVKERTGSFDPSAFRDRYQAALLKLARSKEKPGARKARPISKTKQSRGDNVINLMDALKASIKAEKR